MDDIGKTIKSVIFQKLKSRQIVVHTPKEFCHAAMKFVPSNITVYLPRSDEIVEPESVFRHHPSPKQFQSTNLPNRPMTEEMAVQNFSRRQQTRKYFTLNGTIKLTLFAVTRSPIKAITSVQCVENGIQKTGVNDCNVPFVNNVFTKYVFTFKSNF